MSFSLQYFFLRMAIKMVYWLYVNCDLKANQIKDWQPIKIDA